MTGDCYERDGTDFSNEAPEGQGAEFGLTVRSHKANDPFSQLPSSAKLSFAYPYLSVLICLFAVILRRGPRQFDILILSK